MLQHQIVQKPTQLFHDCTENFKDTHREKAPSNKTPTLSKIMNIIIWVVGTSNQLIVRGS